MALSRLLRDSADVPPFTLVEAIREARSLNKIGLERNGVPERSALKQAYRSFPRWLTPQRLSATQNSSAPKSNTSSIRRTSERASTV